METNLKWRGDGSSKSQQMKDFEANLKAALEREDEARLTGSPTMERKRSNSPGRGVIPEGKMMARSMRVFCAWKPKWDVRSDLFWFCCIFVFLAVVVSLAVLCVLVCFFSRFLVYALAFIIIIHVFFSHYLEQFTVYSLQNRVSVYRFATASRRSRLHLFSLLSYSERKKGRCETSPTLSTILMRYSII